jgi:hypothetical protein
MYQAQHGHFPVEQPPARPQPQPPPAQPQPQQPPQQPPPAQPLAQPQQPQQPPSQPQPQPQPQPPQPQPPPPRRRPLLQTCDDDYDKLRVAVVSVPCPPGLAAAAARIDRPQRDVVKAVRTAVTAALRLQPGEAQLIVGFPHTKLADGAATGFELRVGVPVVHEPRLLALVNAGRSLDVALGGAVVAGRMTVPGLVHRYPLRLVGMPMECSPALVGRLLADHLGAATSVVSVARAAIPDGPGAVGGSYNVVLEATRSPAGPLNLEWARGDELLTAEARLDYTTSARAPPASPAPVAPAPAAAPAATRAPARPSQPPRQQQPSQQPLPAQHRSPAPAAPARAPAAAPAPAAASAPAAPAAAPAAAAPAPARAAGPGPSEPGAVIDVIDTMHVDNGRKRNADDSDPGSDVWGTGV